MGSPCTWTLKLAKYYLAPIASNTMAEIQCPHCDGDIELDGAGFGLFDCPECGKEFSWDSDNETGGESKLKVFLSSKIGFVIFFLAIIACTIIAIEQTTSMNLGLALIIFGVPIASIALVIYVLLLLIEKYNSSSKR